MNDITHLRKTLFDAADKIPEGESAEGDIISNTLVSVAYLILDKYEGGDNLTSVPHVDYLLIATGALRLIAPE